MTFIIVTLCTIGAAVVQARAFSEPRDIQTFYLFLLTKGPSWTADITPAVEKIQQDHAVYLAKLGADGRAAIAGPIGGDDDELRGLVILTVKAADEAKAIASADPAVVAGRLKADVLGFSVAGNWFAFAPIKEGLAVRQFVFGVLTSGPNAASPAPPEELATLQAGHLGHLWMLRESGALVMWGPLVAADSRRGIVFLAVDEIAKARELAEADPMVRAGRFAVELHRWYAFDDVMKIVK